MQGPPGIPGNCHCDISMPEIKDLMETVKRQSVEIALTTVHQEYRDLLKKMKKRIFVLEEQILSKFFGE